VSPFDLPSVSFSRELIASSTAAGRDKGIALPGAILSISPWSDIEMKSKTPDSNASIDNLSRQGLVAIDALGPAGEYRTRNHEVITDTAGATVPELSIGRAYCAPT
jgi:hypothetical protein